MKTFFNLKQGDIIYHLTNFKTLLKYKVIYNKGIKGTRYIKLDTGFKMPWQADIEDNYTLMFYHNKKGCYTDYIHHCEGEFFTSAEKVYEYLSTVSWDCSTILNQLYNITKDVYSERTE